MPTSTYTMVERMFVWPNDAAGQCGDEIDLRDTDEQPIEAPDDDEQQEHGFEVAHGCLLHG